MPLEVKTEIESQVKVVSFRNMKNRSFNQLLLCIHYNDEIFTMMRFKGIYKYYSRRHEKVIFS